MDADCRNQIRNEVGDLKADGTGGVDAAMGVAVDGVDSDARLEPVLPMNRRGYNGGRKTGQSPNLNNASRRKNTQKRSEEKINARTDAAGVKDIIEIDHSVENLDLARRGNFSGMAQFLGELPVLDLELIPVLELPDIEVARSAWGGVTANRFANFPRKLEPPAGRRMTYNIKPERERIIHRIAIFLGRGGQTNNCSRRLGSTIAAPAGSQNLRDGPRRWVHHAKSIKLKLASRRRVACPRAHQLSPGTRQNFIAAIAITTNPSPASHPNT